LAVSDLRGNNLIIALKIIISKTLFWWLVISIPDPKYRIINNCINCKWEIENNTWVHRDMEFLWVFNCLCNRYLLSEHSYLKTCKIIVIFHVWRHRWYYVHARAWIWILSSSGQLDISRVSAAHEWDITLNPSESISECVFINNINSSEIPNHESCNYYVTIMTVISSRVKTTCYLHVWKYEVFAGKLTWYFTDVYIINRISQLWKSLWRTPVYAINTLRVTKFFKYNDLVYGKLNNSVAIFVLG